jgi:hypothetical protein
MTPLVSHPLRTPRGMKANVRNAGELAKPHRGVRDRKTTWFARCRVAGECIGVSPGPQPPWTMEPRKIRGCDILTRSRLWRIGKASYGRRLRSSSVQEAEATKSAQGEGIDHKRNTVQSALFGQSLNMWAFPSASAKMCSGKTATLPPWIAGKRPAHVDFVKVR